MNNIDAIYNKFANSSILIWGFGREGKSTLAFLRKAFPQKQIWVGDVNEISIQDENVVSFKIDKWKEDYNKFDYIFKSPGISVCNIQTDAIDIKKLTSQTEIFFSLYREQIIGITGTKGKSTVSSLLYHIIKLYSDNTVFVGNIGIPCLDMVDKIDENTVIIFELSCHQLEFVTLSPHISVILNLFEEHLDHYGTFEKYVDAKKNILNFQTSDDIAIINADNIKAISPKNHCITASMNKTADIEVQKEALFVMGNKIDISRDDTRLVGVHNLYNIAVAYYICCVIKKIPTDFFKNGLKTFNGLKHRLQYVGTYNNILFYNDSISTVCNATIQGIEALSNVDTILIGGMDRKIDYNPLVNYIASSHINNIILMGETTARILSLFENAKNTKNKKVLVSSSLENAVEIANKVTKPNAICLLSPAASSYDQFKNFEERGLMFEKYVKNSSKIN